MVSQCFAKAVDTGSVPVDETVECVFHQAGKISLSVVSGRACQPCSICNPLLGEGNDNICPLEPSWIAV
eukprot:2365362-Ditylum_brightwellii.AAC.1